MYLWAAVPSVVAAMWLLVRNRRASETCLVRTIAIRAPAPVVFDLVGRVDWMPEWYRKPGWMRGLIGVSILSRWGEHIPCGSRADKPGNGNEIRIRWMHNRELGYTHLAGALEYHSTFRLSARDRGCLLTWEVRYRMPRIVDLVTNHPVIEPETSRSMTESLEIIRCVAERRVAAWEEDNRIPVWQRVSSKAS